MRAQVAPPIYLCVTLAKGFLEFPDLPARVIGEAVASDEVKEMFRYSLDAILSTRQEQPHVFGLVPPAYIPQLVRLGRLLFMDEDEYVRALTAYGLQA